MRNVTWVGFTLATIVTSSAACGSDSGGARDTGHGTDTAIETETEVETETETETEVETETETETETESETESETEISTELPPPADVTVERFGARLWGPILALSRTDRTLWIGTRGNPDPYDDTRIRAGLVRLALDSGEVTVYDDALPTDDYGFIGLDGLSGPVSTAGVEADEAPTGARFVAVARTGLLAIGGGDNDSVTPFAVDVPGLGTAIPIAVRIARDGARPVAWMTSNLGLLRLDEDSFQVETRVTATDLGYASDSDGEFGPLAVDPDTGTAFAAFYPHDLQTGGLPRVVRVDISGHLASWIPGAAGTATGLVGDLVWSPSDHGVYIAVGSWTDTKGGVVFWDGSASGGARTVVSEAALGRDGTPIGAQVLALDDARHLLAVGGRLHPSGVLSPIGGGLVWVDLTGALAGGSPNVLRLGDKGLEHPFVALHINAMTFDPETQRLYVALSDICDETRLKARGLYALRFDDAGHLHFERPLLSGIRATAVLGDDLWVGLRDDNLGLACQGYPIQTGLAHVFANGAAEVATITATGDDQIRNDPATTAIDGTESQFVLGTWRDGFFVGSFASGLAGNPTFFGPSLFIEDVLLEPASDAGDKNAYIWIAGRTTHQNGDPPQLDDRGPRGVARLLRGPDGLTTDVWYVRATDDPRATPGLPSGDVRDLLQTPDGVVAACATEQVEGSSLDRAEGEPFKDAGGKTRPGGVVRLVPGAAPLVLADAATAPDARALALGPSGALWVADRLRGVLVQDGATWTPHPWPALPDDAIPQALLADDATMQAIATSKGLYVLADGRPLVLDDVGFAWALARHLGALWAGTDVGLVAVRPTGTPRPILPAPPVGAAPPFAVR